jgi:CheY-like chemotaxis protein
METGDGYYENLPIIALTANVLSGQREMFLANDIDDFLAKPIEMHELNKILDKWLPDNKKVESDWQKQNEGVKGEYGDIVIPGVNVQEGLRNCGGKLPVYFNILLDFCKDAESRLKQISAAFANENARLYTTLVHALKGAAKSVGAVETGEKALWLEKASETWEMATLKEKTEELEKNVLTLIENIRTALTEAELPGSAETMDTSALKLEVLKNALQKMDIETVNKMLLEYANLSLNAQTKDMISELEDCILMFEYENAIKKIEQEVLQIKAKHA